MVHRSLRCTCLSISNIASLPLFHWHAVSCTPRLIRGIPSFFFFYLSRISLLTFLHDKKTRLVPSVRHAYASEPKYSGTCQKEVCIYSVLLLHLHTPTSLFPLSPICPSATIHPHTTYTAAHHLFSFPLRQGLTIGYTLFTSQTHPLKAPTHLFLRNSSRPFPFPSLSLFSRTPFPYLWCACVPVRLVVRCLIPNKLHICTSHVSDECICFLANRPQCSLEILELRIELR
ncbi:uncharacterized protein F4807DRAFT_131807 [Annulohypoxylon truncatum]|uniref:uncharacterized protein n=1 Tax=Annulohypoxylon truncatum TaxID=327061 RepID=UPI002007503F|nr:uncharacterized protein F4807DRAFT_131807 [Annulohypoxylon truncatum]KAI1208732.1 hypothetical protein F4807DRAFT_131807 [Annulohypoxylon truncatum]